MKKQKPTAAVPADLDAALACLADAFAEDPLTGFLLESGPHYRGRVTQFFSLLMRARLALHMPVLVLRDATGIHGAAMGYSTKPPAWPDELAEEWERFEKTTPGLTERIAVYDGISAKLKPAAPHYYLGVIGIDPRSHGRGLGLQLIQAFCELSARDPLSAGVYLETANPSNVRFYERAGFAETGRGNLGRETLWCMFHRHSH